MIFEPWGSTVFNIFWILILLRPDPQSKHSSVALIRIPFSTSSVQAFSKIVEDGTLSLKLSDPLQRYTHMRLKPTASLRYGMAEAQRSAACGELVWVANL